MKRLCLFVFVLGITHIPIAPVVAQGGSDRDFEPTIERAVDRHEEIRPVGEAPRGDIAPKTEPATPPKEDGTIPPQIIQPDAVRSVEQESRQKEQEIFQKYEKKFDALRKEISPDAQWANPADMEQAMQKMTPEQRGRVEEARKGFEAEWDIVRKERNEKIGAMEKEWMDRAREQAKSPEEISRLEGELARNLRQSPEERRQGEMKDREQQINRMREEMGSMEKMLEERLGKDDSQKYIHDMREQFDREVERMRQQVENEQSRGRMEPPLVNDNRQMEQQIQRMQEFEKIQTGQGTEQQIRDQLRFMEQEVGRYQQEQMDRLTHAPDAASKERIQQEMIMADREYLRRKAELEEKLPKP